jgi:RNA polymerase sigma factor (sigma-70 family)
MKYSERLIIFENVRTRYSSFLETVLWKLSGDNELFTEAMQYALLGMWQNVEKLNSKKAGAYIYRIALTANSKAWRNRIGKDGQISHIQADFEKDPAAGIGQSELATIVRRVIAQLPERQSKAIVMRYLEQKDYQKIAEQLGCSEAGARSNVSKALATLKRRLANLAEGGLKR